MARRIILDCDPGIDDSVALSMALFHRSLDVVAITAVEGNVPAEMATKNVQTVIEQLDPPRLPRIGAATPNDNPDYRDACFIHGRDGLGEAGFVTADHHQRHFSEKIICDEVRAAPGEIDIVCLGPLTNVARAIQRDPHFVENVGEIIMMGGSFNGIGNITQTAEFNIYCDPESARDVFHAPVKKTLIPLDITSQVQFAMNVLDLLPKQSTSVGRFLRRVIPYLFRSYHEQLGLEAVQIHDAIALLQVIEPQLFELEAWAGDVEVKGELTRGMTVFEKRRARNTSHNLEVARVVAASDARQAVMRCLNT
ncbi:MAG: nucleoside hydrolase [Planctomycetaceae bacterium]|mgnify:CR=1 FL=1|nr:nucleoside hydrolase [Planctomycetaceae bacterium]